LQLAIGRHDPDLQLAAATAFSHDKVAQACASIRSRTGPLVASTRSLGRGAAAGQAAAGAASIPRGEALGAAPAQRHLARQVAALGCEQAVLDRRHAVASGGDVKAAHQLPGLTVTVTVARGDAERVLELVAVAPRFDRGHDLL